MNNTYNRILNLVVESDAQKRSVLDLARSHMTKGTVDTVTNSRVTHKDQNRGQSKEGASKTTKAYRAKVAAGDKP
tara:strand:+ start:4352 stop:4576 length:225 start_codon:yes stop_codon:yes gene_type:complete